MNAKTRVLAEIKTATPLFSSDTLPVRTHRFSTQAEGLSELSYMCIQTEKVVEGHCCSDGGRYA